MRPVIVHAAWCKYFMVLLVYTTRIFGNGDMPRALAVAVVRLCAHAFCCCRLRKAEEQNRLLAREAELAKERSQMAEVGRTSNPGVRASSVPLRLLCFCRM